MTRLLLDLLVPPRALCWGRLTQVWPSLVDELADRILAAVWDEGRRTWRTEEAKEPDRG